MKAMVLYSICNLGDGKDPLILVDMPDPIPRENEVLIRVSRCGVCHTELDEIEGRTPPSKLPIILGHQIVGTVEQTGPGAKQFAPGDRVGVGWIFSSCGKCKYCARGGENLCDNFRATGRDADGGYAEYVAVPEDAAHRIPDILSDSEAAPLFCAGAIGYRALKLAALNDGDSIGLSGFGASGHLVIKMVRHMYPNSKIFVFSRTEKERDFSRELGASWTGDIGDRSPEKLHSIIDTTPVWRPVVESLKNLEKGGRLVVNAIRKEDKDKELLSDLDYARDLWMEREIKSVANITRQNIEEFLKLAADIPILPEVQELDLAEANRALRELRERKIRGAKVLVVSHA